MKRPRHRNQGAATLTAVLVMLLLALLLSTHASRDLVFEQRSSLQSLRAAQALAAAEAGLDWAVAMVNAGRVDGQCAPSTQPQHASLRERVLQIDPATGALRPRAAPASEDRNADTAATCVLDAASPAWRCRCPGDAAEAITGPTSPTSPTAPAFRVHWQALAAEVQRDDLVRVVAVGCAAHSPACLEVSAADTAAAAGLADVHNARRVVSAVLMAGQRALTLPVAALTVRGSVAGQGLSLHAPNGPGAWGLAVHASGAVDLASLHLATAPGGVPSHSVRAHDATLHPPALAPFSVSDRFFALWMGLPPQAWREQPVVHALACPPQGCSAALLRATVAAHPGRPLWLSGTLRLDSPGDIGSPQAPLWLVVEGGVHAVGEGATLHALVLLRPAGASAAAAASPTPALALQGRARIRGALIVDGDVAAAQTADAAASAALDIVYDAPLLQRLRTTPGNLTRVAGSWRDWGSP